MGPINLHYLMLLFLAPYKQGWTQDEHVRFLRGLQIYGKGAWKEIAQIVGTRNPTQIQVHAQRVSLESPSTFNVFTENIKKLTELRSSQHR
jgi:SHAQKYF class myb-like DNA-binding protein